MASIGSDPSSDKSKNNDIIVIADTICKLIDATALAANLGVNVDKGDPHQVQARAEAEKEKGILVEALSAKAKVLLSESEGKEPAGIEDIGEESELDRVYKELKKWTSVDAKDHFELHSNYLRRKGHKGMLLKLINKILPESGPKAQSLHEQKSKIISSLDHPVFDSVAFKAKNFPKDYPCF